MRLRYPRYFPAFRCLAGACPDTCCRDWEVTLDAAAAADYARLPGPLGEDVRAAMARRDGETVLALRGGLCPMLDGDGLCRIQRELGEERLCRSCALHPRFAEEYGALREWSLSLACPEAARLLLEEDAPAAFLEETTDEPPAPNDLDARLFYALLAFRRAALAMAQDGAIPWQHRLARLLRFAGAWQRTLDQHRLGRLAAVTARFAEGRFAAPVPGTDPAHAGRLLARLRDLEPINEAWTALLARALAAPPHGAEPPGFPAAAERLLVYYLYRYVLKAVVDRRLLCRVQLAAVGVLCARELERCAGRIDGIHRLSRQVEHSPENLRQVLAWCEADADFSPQSLTAAAW